MISKSARIRKFAAATATSIPIAVDPVAETSGMRLSAAKRPPTVATSPMTRVKIAASTPVSKQTCSAMRVTAMAQSGALFEGFQQTASPQTAASALFHAQTATGKLKAVITPTMPNGCHCSIRRCLGRSD